MPPIAARDVQAARLARAYEDAYRRLIAEEQRILDNPLAFRRRARLVELQHEVERQMQLLDGKVRGWLSNALPAVWSAGAVAMSADGSFGWTLLHREGLQQVAAQTYDYLLDATRYVNASTKAMIRAITHEETLAKLTTGQTAVQEGRTIMQRIMAETGLSRVAYRNGALHPVREYGHMVARTQSALAYNYGGLQQGLDEGVTMYEVFDGLGCGVDGHDDPRAANGEVFTAKEMAQNPISHPNCVRAFGPRPDLKAKGKQPVSAVETAASKATSPAGRTFAKQSAMTRREKRLASRAAKVGR